MGDNCWVPLCGMNRKTKGIYMHKFPITKHPEDIKWRENLTNMVMKYRDPRIDPRNLAERLKSGKIFTCERHFRPEDFEYTKTGMKKLKLYVMPSLKLPAKSKPVETASSILVSVRLFPGSCGTMVSIWCGNICEIF